MEEKSAFKGAPPPYLEDPVVGINPTYIKPQARRLHDTAVQFEEYHYYAQRTREEQKTLENPGTNWRHVFLGKKKQHAENQEPVPENIDSDKFATASNRIEISDEEWTNASRAFRTASWGACESFMPRHNFTAS